MRFAHFEFDPEQNRLGEGPQSEVFQAVDTRLGRTVALKILRPHVEFDPAAKERFEREAKHTSNLAHPNIATIYEYGQDRGTSYIAMEYLEGRTLDKIIKDNALPYEEAVRIALQVTGALTLVHDRGLIHRDLKPANIMIQGDGTVKLLDFGICRSTAESNITQDGMLVGTVLYMSPEQVLGDDLDVRADVFALGSVLYHSLTGELPFPGKSFPEVCMAILDANPQRPSELRSGFPEPLEEFLMRCLTRDLDTRYPDARSCHGALLAVADSLRMRTMADVSAVAGDILIQPFEVRGTRQDGAKAFASGLRRDLYSELGRSTQLDVTLPETGEFPPEFEQGFVMRGTLTLEADEADVDFVLERANSRSREETTHIWQEKVHHADEDEWSLQAKLVSSLARSMKRRLAEFSVEKVTEPARDPEGAIQLAMRAHTILHKGTSRHLMAAISTFRRALEEDPRCALAHAGLAEALARKYVYWDGDRSFVEECRETARRALAFDSFCAEAHTALGFAHMMMGEGAGALRELRLAIQLNNDEWLAHRLLGAMLGRQGNLEGASPLLQRAIALRPTHIGSYDHLYMVLCRLDRYQEAIEVADRGIAIARKHLRDVPDDQEARLHLALLLARMGLADDARAEVKNARERFPKDAYTNYQAALVGALLGEADEAIALLREAQLRGFHLQSEVMSNTDLELLRGRPEFQMLVG